MFLEQEGSCDTEDWSNDAENSALHHRNNLHFKMYSNIEQNSLYNCKNISLIIINNNFFFQNS